MRKVAANSQKVIDYLAEKSKIFCCHFDLMNTYEFYIIYLLLWVFYINIFKKWLVNKIYIFAAFVIRKIIYNYITTNKSYACNCILYYKLF